MTTKVKVSHTPGPWRYEDPSVSDDGVFTEAMIWHDGDGTSANPIKHIAVIRCGLQESDYNGSLIAAAPELLAALRNMRLCGLRGDNPYGHDCRWCGACCKRAADEADAAIRKVEDNES